MSKFVKVTTELREVALIKRSLDDLKIHYEENAHYDHLWSGTRQQVPLLIKHTKANFGFRESTDGVYEVIGDDMQMRGIRSVLNKVQQRYAYHKVIQETQNAGFDLVEEATGRDRVIRLTVRRWA